MEKKKLVILTGPTAVGKSDLSIALAKKIGGEIISADSVQVYKYMDIGSAKIAKEEMQGVKHYLLDILEPTEHFDVFLFQKYVKSAMEIIYAKGKIPILVGGTGFYIQAILYDIDFSETAQDDALRKELEDMQAEKGLEFMHQMLAEIDPESAKEIHANNGKRVLRAIEYFRLTGQKISEHNQQQRQKESPYDFVYFVLDDERENLYNRIDKRVDIMFEQGLVEEVERLLAMGVKKEDTSMQALGYKELLPCLLPDQYPGESYDFDTAREIIKRDTRHFAKRQLTWFRRERCVTWIEKQNYQYDEAAILSDMERIIKNEFAGK